MCSRVLPPMRGTGGVCGLCLLLWRLCGEKNNLDAGVSPLLLSADTRPPVLQVEREARPARLVVVVVGADRVPSACASGLLDEHLSEALCLFEEFEEERLLGAQVLLAEEAKHELLSAIGGWGVPEDEATLLNGPLAVALAERLVELRELQADEGLEGPQEVLAFETSELSVAHSVSSCRAVVAETTGEPGG